MATLAEAVDNMVLTQMLEYAWCWGSCRDASSGSGSGSGTPSSGDDVGPQSGGSALFRACALILYLTVSLTKLAYGVSVASFALVSFKASTLGKFEFWNFTMICVGMFVLFTTPGILAFVMSGSFSYSCDGVD